MIRINLLPRKEAEAALGKRNQRALLLLGVAVVALVMILPLMSQRRRIADLDHDIEETQQQIKRLSAQVKEVEQLDQLKADLQTKLRIIEELDEKRIGPQRVLDDLAAATPEKLWLIEFSEIGGDAKLIGFALDNETIADFMRRLQMSRYFSGVDLVETSQSKNQELSGLKRFIINAHVDYVGRDEKAPAGNEGKSEKSARSK